MRFLASLTFITILVTTAPARDVLVIGNAFDLDDTNFTSNLNQLGHTFSEVSTVVWPTQPLDGFDAIWMDGFSQFVDVRAEDLIAFAEAGGTVLIQNPGTGSEPLAEYPFGTELQSVFQADGLSLVRVAADHPINAQLTNALLSNWSPTSALGFFTNIGDFTGLTDIAADSWVTIIRDIGTGHIIYTHQPLVQALREKPLGLQTGPVLVTDAILSFGDALVPRAAQFVNESHFWRDDNGDLVGLLPNPNADGLDSSGEKEVVYELATVADNVISNGPQILTAQQWPQTWRVDAMDLPMGRFQVQIVRREAGVNKTLSAPVLRLSPEAQTDPGNLFSYSRWLLHIPRQQGGFEGVIRLANALPNSDAEVSLIAFGFSGQLLGRELVQLGPSETLFRDLYGSAPDALFTNPDLTDQISHIAIWDPTGQTEVAVSYRNIQSRFGTWVNEVDIDSGTVSGSAFTVNSGTPNGNYYDGVAVLNLRLSADVDVRVRRFDRTGADQGEAFLGTLGPGEKLLSILTFEFSNVIADPVYLIEAEGPKGTESIQVLGLTGTVDNAFFAPVTARKLR